MTVPTPQVVTVETAAGPGRWHVTRPSGVTRGQLLLGHGAGGGVNATDLAALAMRLPASGVLVCRFEQPWRVAGRKVAGPPAALDRAWCEAAPSILDPSLPLVVGGRSAGARVACRTAPLMKAAAVLLIAFPLHPPGRPERSRADELPDGPLLAVQGERDAFGGPDELRPHLGQAQELIGIPDADHSLKVRRAGPTSQEDADDLLVRTCSRWLGTLLDNPG